MNLFQLLAGRMSDPYQPQTIRPPAMSTGYPAQQQFMAPPMSGPTPPQTFRPPAMSTGTPPSMGVQAPPMSTPTPATSFNPPPMSTGTPPSQWQNGQGIPPPGFNKDNAIASWERWRNLTNRNKFGWAGMGAGQPRPMDMGPFEQ